MKKLILIGFALLCFTCVLGITFVLYDVVASATRSEVSGYGAAAVFIMAVAFTGRWLWENRQIER